MPLLHAALLLLVLAASRQGTNPQYVDCREWQACRQLAVDAAGRQDFEAFHDLAWRAMQLGPKNDPGLMYLLARAQSLSGRPGDALVMLQRLVDAGVPIDAATNDDFRRVRALPGWAELKATHSASPKAGTTETTKSSVAKSAITETEKAASMKSGAAERAGASVLEPSFGAAENTTVTESLRFTTPQFTPAGLAYDAVSRRFVVGDRHGRKLAVVDEFSRHVANLAGALSSGFGEIAALEIDPREGYLWVVSSDGGSTTLHKLQLISGRLLAGYPLPERFAPVSFGDVAVTPASTVLALDTRGHRIFRLRARETATELAITLRDGVPASIAPVDEDSAYVSSDAGLMRVDLAARSTMPVEAAAGVDLTGLARIRWHQGSLVGIQKTSDAIYRAVRIRLDRSGRTAIAIRVLDARLSTTDPTAATVAGGVLYYLASGEGTEMIVRRVSLK
jgi:hypothetical protein